AMIGLGSGGIFGRGLGQSIEKANFLPEAHTDMIFAIIGEELGLVGATALIAAYATFAYAGLRIALRCRDPFGKALATGVTMLVCGQAAINIAAAMGLAPLTGIPLPSVSYAASSLIDGLAGVGLLLTIAAGGALSLERAVPSPARWCLQPRSNGRRPRCSRRMRTWGSQTGLRLPSRSGFFSRRRSPAITARSTASRGARSRSDRKRRRRPR